MAKKKSTKRLLIKNSYIVVLCIFLAIFIGLAIFNGTVKVSKPSVVSISTEAIPELHPHKHGTGDSIFNKGHHEIAFSQVYRLPKGMWVKSFELKVKNSHRSTLHHALLFRVDQKDHACKNYYQAIFITSPENNHSPTVFPDDYAMYLPKGTPLVFEAMFHNPEPPLGVGKEFENVTAEIILKGVEDSLFQRFKKVDFYRVHISDNPCGNPLGDGETFEVPPNTTITKNRSLLGKAQTNIYKFSESGVILQMAGHIHSWDGGKRLDVHKSGKLIHTFTPYLETKDLWSWKNPFYSVLLRVKKNEEISISATYENPNSVPVRGAMGMMVFYFAKD